MKERNENLGPPKLACIAHTNWVIAMIRFVDTDQICKAGRNLPPSAVSPLASVFYPPLDLALHIIISLATSCEDRKDSADTAGSPAAPVREMPKGMSPAINFLLFNYYYSSLPQC